MGKNRNTGKFSSVSSELFLVKGFSAFCYRHAALHTEHYARTHRECSTGGVFPDALPYTQLPTRLFTGNKGKTQIQKWKKNPKSTNTLNIGTEKQVDMEKSSFTQYVSAASKTESNGDALLLLALRMGSSTV